MSITRFKSYTPGDKSYSRRRTEEEWELHHQLLSDMHAQRYTRKEMLAKLRELGFEVSPGQLLAQMKKWDLMVYAERASQSAVTYQPLSESAVHESSDPIIIDGENIDNATNPMFDTTLTDELTPPPLFTEDASLTVRRYSTAEQSDDTTGGLSFSSIEDIHELQELPQQEYENRSRGITPPPDYPIDEATIVQPCVPAFEVIMADSSSILRQLSTVMEPWCGNFPTTCCCHALFFGEDNFKKSPGLYTVILEQSSPQSLKYIMALLNLAGTNPTGERRIELQNHLRTTVEYYLRICTRVEHKNRLAPYILHRLLKVWEDFSDGEHTSFPGSELSRHVTARSNESLLKKIFKTRSTIDWKVQYPSNEIDWHRDSERDVGCVVGFTARKPSTFPLLNSDGEVFGSTKSWSTLEEWCTLEDPNVSQKPLIELIPTARQIASYMQSQWDNGLVMHTAYDLGDCDLPLIFMALGLMIALEAASSAQTLINSDHDLAAQNTWTPGIRAFIDTTVSTLSLNADYADKFRKAYWLIRCSQIGHRGKLIHMGERCTALNEWKLLDRNILFYDEPRTWIERRLFSSSRSTTWPQMDDLMVDDNMSIRSTSSINSFRRFQALALHLKIGTPLSRSLKTKSTKSSRMSTESHLSWQLEHMLEIRGDENGCEVEKEWTEDEDKRTERGGDADIPLDLGPVQRAPIDQMAFERMQVIDE